MRREAHFREHALFKGGWDEEFYYAILEDEWREQQENAGFSGVNPAGKWRSQGVMHRIWQFLCIAVERKVHFLPLIR